MSNESHEWKYWCNLSGLGLFGVAIYGAAEYLRGKRLFRGVVATLGVLMVLAHPLASSGIKLPIVGVPWIIGLLLICLAVISGKDFYLNFSSQAEEDEIRATEEKLENASDPEQFISLDKERLNEYYTINQAQAKASYRWAIFGIVCGIPLVLYSIWAFSLAPSSNKLAPQLSAGGGIAANIVSGLFLRLHSKTQDVALKYHDQLMKLQRLQMAMRLAKGLSDENDKKIAVGKIIDKLTDSA